MKDMIKKESGKALTTSDGKLDFEAMRKRKQALQPISAADAALQALWMFDITGSTFEYFDMIRKHLAEITSAIKKEAPTAQFSIFAFRNHGDEASYEKIYYAFPMTADIERIHADISDIESGGGGPDGLTCMEDCLNEANKLPWSKHAPKAIVIIGDQPPHGLLDRVSKCPREYDYRAEIKMLKEKGIKIYTVFCGHNEDVRAFYQSVAKETGGRFLPISELPILKELMIGICMKETGSLVKFKESLRKAHKLDHKTEKALLLLE